MPESLSAEAKHALESLGVEVRLGAAVTDIVHNAVSLGAETIKTETIIWAAGVRASAAGQWLNAATDRAGRVVVSGDFSLPGHPEVFVAVDTAAFTHYNGKMLPGVAPAAKQAGAYVGSLIAAQINGTHKPHPFFYADYGNLATVGRRNAVADFGRVTLKGMMGWLLWSFAHVYFLIGFRNRISVAAGWAWSYITYQRGVRLITGTDHEAETRMEEAA
jgi:NADH dehydrogenase